ncbi:MAG: CapA family protein [Prevotellaceae bacterium]|jgi:poly-gamma-glutamate synthesis protein (capsule biosynthesis protein)|nr:CapA family protein [Prevotellaceae bacterium]
MRLLRATTIYIALFFSFSANAQDTLRLTFIGDIMQHMPQISGAKYNETYSYYSCFSHIAQHLSEADLTVANLETTLAGPPYAGYPWFAAPDELAYTLKDVGIDILATANNHSCDKGLKGITRTLDVLDSLGIVHLGTYRTQNEKDRCHPLRVEKSGFRLAFLCYTYGTNGLAIPSPTRVNLIQQDSIAKDLASLNPWNPDATIVIIHWGDEYHRLPNTEQKRLANFITDNGATMVIGSHPHVIQPMELRYSGEKPHHSTDFRAQSAVVYSLGNFVSNQERKHTDGGAITYFTLVKENGKTQIADASYSLVWVYKPIEESVKRFYILPVENFEDKSEFFQQGYYPRFMRFVNDARSLLESNNYGIYERKF